MSNPSSPTDPTSQPPLTFGQNTPFLFHSLGKTKPWQPYDPERWHTTPSGSSSGFHIGAQDVEMSDSPRGHGVARPADGSPSQRRASRGCGPDAKSTATATADSESKAATANISEDAMDLDVRPKAKGGMKRELRRRGRRKEQESVVKASEPVSALLVPHAMFC